jgi:hypothetical protein
MKKITTKCLFPRCSVTKIKSRGLCSKHYNVAYSLVKNKITSWKRLEKSKKVGLAKRNSTSYTKDQLYFLGKPKRKSSVKVKVPVKT